MLQENVLCTVAYKAEGNWGEAAGASGAQYLRRMTSSLAVMKDTYASNEVRPDQQVADMRHGFRRAGGGLEGELSLGTYDALLAAAIRSTFASGLSKTNTELTSVAADNAAGTFTCGGSTWQAEGFKIGDVIRFTNLSEAANNDVNYLIVNLNATVATVLPKPTTMTADTSFGVTSLKKAKNGVLKPSFTMEQVYPDIDVSELFTGMCVNNLAVRMPPTGMTTVSMDFLGKDGQVLADASSPYFTSPTAVTDTGIFAAVTGAVSVGGVQSNVMTGLDFSVANNITAQPVMGTNYAPGVFFGRHVVTGNVSCFLEDETWINYFLNETEIVLTAMMELPGTAPLGCVCFTFPRVKLSTPSRTLGPEGGLLCSFPFQALLRSGGAGTNYDQTTWSMQSSAA